MGHLRVIIVNEMDGARRNIKNMLTRHGFIIEAEVKDAAYGVRVLASTAAELVITEDVTPGWPELVRAAREKQIPVLLIVSQEEGDIAPEAAGLGVAGIIVRPLTERNLSVLAKFTALTAYPLFPAETKSLDAAARTRRQLINNRRKRLIFER